MNSEPSLNMALADLKTRLADRVRVCGEQGRSCDCWLGSSHDCAPKIGPRERVSLTAMVAYVSHVTRRPAFGIERELSDHFCVPNPHFLPASKYDQALKFLSEKMTSLAG